MPPGPRPSYSGEIEQNRRDGRLWHDLRDEFGVVWSMPDDRPYYMDISHHPLAEATIADMADYPFPQGRRSQPVRRPAQAGAAASKGNALRGRQRHPGVVYEYCWYMRGLERWFMDLVTQPEFCEALLDQTLKFWLDWCRLFLDEVGDLVDVVMIGDDLAGQTGPLFRPEIYRAIVKPRQKRLVQYIRSRTPAKIWYHTCGSCIPYIPDLLDNGVDMLNPMQVSAKDMDPAALKARFGDRMAFWGGAIDTQHVLPSASPETVRQHVRRNWRRGSRAAATSSTTSTTFRPACRRKTSWPCSTPRTSTGSTSRAPRTDLQRAIVRSATGSASAALRGALAKPVPPNGTQPPYRGGSGRRPMGGNPWSMRRWFKSAMKVCRWARCEADMPSIICRPHIARASALMLPRSALAAKASPAGTTGLASLGTLRFPRFSPFLHFLDALVEKFLLFLRG